MSSNVQIFGRTVENGRIAIRCDNNGYMDTRSILDDGNGNSAVINADGSLNVKNTPSLFPPNINVLLGSDFGILLQASSIPLAAKDPQNGRKGWYYTNYNGVDSGLKMMWFIFDGTSTTYTVGNLKQLSSVLTRDIVGNSPAPFFSVYTKPTGSGDIIPTFAHSSRVYQPQQKPIFGEKHCMYWSSDGSTPVNSDNLLLLDSEIAVTNGDYTDEQEIAFITLQTDSGAVAGQIQNLYENFGYILNDSDPLLESAQNRVLINFDTPSSVGGISNVNVINSSLVVTNTELSQLTFRDSIVTGSQNVNITNAYDTDNNCLQVNQLSPIITALNFNETSFSDYVSGSPLPNNSVSQSFTLTKQTNFILSGYGVKHSSTPSIYLEISNDNFNWSRTNYFSQINDESTRITIQQTICYRYLRFKIVGGEVDTLDLFISYK